MKPGEGIGADYNPAAIEIEAERAADLEELHTKLYGSLSGINRRLAHTRQTDNLIQAAQAAVFGDMYTEPDPIIEISVAYDVLDAKTATTDELQEFFKTVPGATAHDGRPIKMGSHIVKVLTPKLDNPEYPKKNGYTQKEMYFLTFCPTEIDTPAMTATNTHYAFVYNDREERALVALRPNPNIGKVIRQHVRVDGDDPERILSEWGPVDHRPIVAEVLQPEDPRYGDLMAEFRHAVRELSVEQGSDAFLETMHEQ